MCVSVFANKRAHCNEMNEIHLANDTNDVTCTIISPFVHFLQFQIVTYDGASLSAAVAVVVAADATVAAVTAATVVIATQTLSNFQ